MSGKMTTRQKLDEALGISGGMSVDEMLKDLDTQTVSISDKLGGMETAIRESAAKIDQKALELERGETNGVLAISDMNASLREIEGLIGQSKQVFQHMVDNITSSDLLDSELIQAAASFLEALH